MARVTEKQWTELRRSADYSGIKDYPAYNTRVILSWVTPPSVAHEKVEDKKSGDAVATQTIFFYFTSVNTYFPAMKKDAGTGPCTVTSPLVGCEW